MPNSLERIKNQNLHEFLRWNISEQREFLKNIQITNLKHPNDKLMLKKFIAMKILMEARISVTGKGALNLTHNISRIFSNEMRASIENKSEYDKTPIKPGYLFKTSLYSDIKINEDFSIDIKGLSHWAEAETYSNIDDSEELRKIFSMIKEAAKYHTLGFILLKEAFMLPVSNFTVYSKLQTLKFWFSIIVPILALIPSLILSALEYIFVFPTQWIIEKLSSTPNEDFIQELINAADPASAELVKNVNVFKQAQRHAGKVENMTLGALPQEILMQIITYTDDHHTPDEKTCNLISLSLFNNKKKIVDATDIKESNEIKTKVL